MKNRFKIVNKEFDVQIIVTILKRNWWIPILLSTFFWTIAFFYLRYTKPTYQSSMLLQLESKDNAKEVMDIQGIKKDDNMSYEIELLKSQFLFNKALKTLNLHISLFSKGSVLTEEKYKSSVFNVQPFELKDSSLVDIPIILTMDEQENLFLDYVVRGVKYGIKGKVNEHLINQHFDIIIKAHDVKSLRKAIELNQLYFKFNSINSLSARLLSGLKVVPINLAAKTIQLVYTGQNPQLCYDICVALANTFINYDDDKKRK